MRRRSSITERVTPAGNLDRPDRRELLRAKARYDRHGSDDDLRAMVRLQICIMTSARRALARFASLTRPLT
jgi:hypothetical protein